MFGIEKPFKLKQVSERVKDWGNPIGGSRDVRVVPQENPNETGLSLDTVFREALLSSMTLSCQDQTMVSDDFFEP